MARCAPVKSWRRRPSITGVSDRESDIYEHFARRPDNVHLIVRACQNRKIETDDADQINLLFASR